jgi:serine/threonine-protein kinase PknG
VLRTDPWQWRAVWLLGLAELRSGNHVGAREAFNTVYGEVPGELAPKLALALACELAGNLDHAEQLYLTCLRTDANYTAATAFGLARVRTKRYEDGLDDLDPAVDALDLVPTTSRAFVVARQLRAQLLLTHAEGLEHLATAHDSLTGVDLDSAVAIRLRGDILRKALDMVLSTGRRSQRVRIGNVPAREQPLRVAVEAAYRQLVPLTESWPERVRLVDAARAIRRWTWT